MYRPMIIAGVVLALGLMFWSAFWWQRHPSPGQSDQAAATITLAQNNVPLSALTIIADHNGYFARRNLAVTVKSFPSGKLALDAVLGGGADIATVAETPLARAHLAGIPVLAVANIATSTNDIKVAYRSDKGISKPSDLVGRTIATPLGTSAEYYTDTYLASLGLKTGDVHLINLPPAQMVQALLSGDIAAFSVWEPFPHTAKVSDKNIAIFDSPGLYTETFNIAVKPSYALAHADVLTKFLLALSDAQKFAATSRTESIAIVASSTGINQQTLEGIWDQFSFQVSDPMVLLDTLGKEEAWIKNSGTSPTGATSSPRTIIDSSFVQHIR